MGAQSEPVHQTLEQELDYTRLPEQRVVVLPIPIPGFAMYLPMIQGTRGMPRPRAWWTLSMSPQPHVLTRTGPNSLELSLTRGQFLTSELETVLEADAAGPKRLGFDFDVPLEDPSLVFLAWKDGLPRRTTPPPVGERVALSP